MSVLQPPHVAPRLSAELSLRIYDLMLRARLLEERLILMYKQGDGFFWIGGPGEEAFNVPLGLLVDKGFGVQHDYLHLHYRSSATLLATSRPVLNHSTPGTGIDRQSAIVMRIE